MKAGIKMKTVKRCLPGLLGLVLFMSCGEVSGKRIDYKLQGTWESTDTSLYSGTLVMDYDTITITGYAESQTPLWGGDDNKRPFKDFAKGAPLQCYTEDGQLFIQAFGEVKGVPYQYSVNNLDKYILFSFGGRQEALKKRED
jgi:hypothetical protein